MQVESLYIMLLMEWRPLNCRDEVGRMVMLKLKLRWAGMGDMNMYFSVELFRWTLCILEFLVLYHNWIFFHIDVYKKHKLMWLILTHFFKQTFSFVSTWKMVKIQWHIFNIGKYHMQPWNSHALSFESFTITQSEHTYFVNFFGFLIMWGHT
jgi:hypothetical protein